MGRGRPGASGFRAAAVTAPGRIAQVVPDIPTFAVDDGFSYSISPDMNVELGTIVRVPLGGRRVRGHVVGLRTGETDSLKPINAVSSSFPIFHTRLLETLRWLATHYVAPLSVLLSKAAPPNLPRPVRIPSLDPIATQLPSPIPDLSKALAEGRHARPHYLLTRWPHSEPIAALAAPVLQAQRSVVAVVSTVAEVEALATELEERFPGRVLRGYTALAAGKLTAEWTRASTQPGLLIVGTREAALWPVTGLALMVVVEEGRRAMKEKQTPTIHVREVARRRAAIERHGLVFLGAVPTTELLAAGIPISRTGGTRIWPLVEVVDRTEEPPGAGFVSSRALAAIRGTVDKNRRALVFTHRRGFAPAFRCSVCRVVRQCQVCEARADRSDRCVRCSASLGDCVECGGKRFEPLGAGVERLGVDLERSFEVGEVGSSAPVWLGTERDLAGAHQVDLAVVVDADGLIHAPHYRAAEDALRILSRVAGMVGRGGGRRCLIQTGLPNDPVIVALRHGDPLKFLEREIEKRAESRLPPSGEVIVVELDTDGEADDDLRGLGRQGVEIFGPASRDGHFHWLIQGRDLRRVRVGLRRVVHEWRERGIRVRVDVDPLQL